MNNKPFKPGKELTFKSVLTVRELLHVALKRETATIFCIDLSEVHQCDSAGLALLIEARKLCAKNQKHLQVIGFSKKTHSLAEFCGVDSLLEPKHVN